ncbi:MAG: DsbE family thiol:disulfide interchange protein [Magnetospirillum sp.]|nr:DsbE family thiol:disulfide interchange protein [Magnetospirillum sp.]
MSDRAKTAVAMSNAAQRAGNATAGWKAWCRPTVVVPLLFGLGVAVYVIIGMLMPGQAPVPGDSTTAANSSQTMDEPAPSLSGLSALTAGKPTLADADLRAGRVTIVNFFASWCVPCRVEAPVLMELARSHQVPVLGVDFRDEPGAAARWVTEVGDPYERIGVDRDGRAGVGWGVLGLPATFVVDQHGHIRYRHLGLITREAMETEILPLVRKLGDADAARAK